MIGFNLCRLSFSLCGSFFSICGSPLLTGYSPWRESAGCPCPEHCTDTWGIGIQAASQGHCDLAVVSLRLALLPQKKKQNKTKQDSKTQRAHYSNKVVEDTGQLSSGHWTVETLLLKVLQYYPPYTAGKPWLLRIYNTLWDSTRWFHFPCACMTLVTGTSNKAISKLLNRTKLSKPNYIANWVWHGPILWHLWSKVSCLHIPVVRSHFLFSIQNWEKNWCFHLFFLHTTSH